MGSEPCITPTCVSLDDHRGHCYDAAGVRLTPNWFVARTQALLVGTVSAMVSAIVWCSSARFPWYLFVSPLLWLTMLPTWLLNFITDDRPGYKRIEDGGNSAR